MAAPLQDAVHWGFQCHQLNIFTEWILGTRDSFNFTQLKVISIDFFVDGFSARSLIEQGRTPVTLSNTSSQQFFITILFQISRVSRWPGDHDVVVVVTWRGDAATSLCRLTGWDRHHNTAGTVRLEWKSADRSTQSPHTLVLELEPGDGREELGKLDPAPQAFLPLRVTPWDIILK